MEQDMKGGQAKAHQQFWLDQRKVPSQQEQAKK